MDLDVSQTDWLLGDRKSSGPGSSGNCAQRVDGQRQLGQSRGVAAQSVDDDAGHLTPYCFGGEELTEHRLFGGPGVDDQDVASPTLLQTGEYRYQVAGSCDRDRPADHPDATRVRAKLPGEDSQCLVGVGETRRVELPDWRRDRRAGGHQLPCPGVSIWASRLILRHPPARLLAMICRNISPRAWVLIFSFWRIETMRPVLLSWPAVMMPSGSGTMVPS